MISVKKRTKKCNKSAYFYTYHQIKPNNYEISN